MVVGDISLVLQLAKIQKKEIDKREKNKDKCLNEKL